MKTKEKSIRKNTKSKVKTKKKVKRKLNFSFSKKLVVLFCVPLCLIGFIVATISSVILRDNLNAEIQEGLQMAAVSLETTYASLYQGDYYQDQGGTLYKGETRLSGDTSLLDALKENAGVDTTFYFGNRIVMTSLRMVTGARAVGLKLEPELYDRITAGEVIFEPAYEFQKVQYFGYFRPLKNADGSVVGAIFAGRPSTEVSSQVNKEMQKILVPTFAIMVVFLVVVFLFAKYLSGNMRRTKKFLEKVSEGDLVEAKKEKAVKNRDEIGDIYNISLYLREELRRIVTNMKASADMLTNSAGVLTTMSENMCSDVVQLYDGMELIAQDASTQAGKTTESVDNIYNISTQIEFISKEMESMYETVSVMSEAEKKSTLLMRDLNASNTEMTQTVGKIATQVDRTNASVQSIQQTIDIIHEIADETDLLSVNASIEAAHAGSAGRGFAVIAEQISKLATQSAANAESVERTISGLKEESEKMVAIMVEVQSRMDSQNSKLTESMNNFNSVAKGVESSMVSVKNINCRMEELDKAKEVILDRVKSLSDIAEKFVTSTEVMIDTVGAMDERMKNLGETAKQLEDISGNLNSGLDIFKL